MSRILLTAILLVLLSTSLVWGDDFCDFRIPKHYVWNTTGNASAGYWESDHSSNGYSSRSDRSNGSLAGNGYWLWDSDPYRGRISAATSFSGGWDRSHSRPEPGWSSDSRSSSDQRQVASSSALTCEGRAYPWQIPLGITTGLSSSFNVQKMWTHDHARNPAGAGFYEDRNDNWSWDRRFSMSADAGVGWGRVRDASTVYDVYEVERRLREDGVLVHDLSKSARERLVSLLYIQHDYYIVHDRDSKFFWQEFENILREDSALKDNRLTAYDLYRVAEPYFSGRFSAYNGDGDGSPEFGSFLPRPSKGGEVNGARFLRESGWFLGAIASGSHYHELARLNSHYFNSNDGFLTSGQELHRSSDHFSWGPQLEFHRPFGMRWQYDVASAVTFPQQSGRAAIESNSYMQAIYLIADRWQGQVLVEHSRDHYDASKGASYPQKVDEWFAELAASLNYYVEDHCAITASLSHYQYSRYDTFDGSAEFNRSTTFTVGFAYRFTAGLDAPGIVPASRPMLWK